MKNKELGDTLDNRQGILSLWLTWMESTGAVLCVILAPLVVKPLWVPFVAIVLETALWFTLRRNREMQCPKCYLIPFVTSRALLWSALFMFFVAIYESATGSGRLKTALPFIPELIVAPLLMLMTLWRRVKKLKFLFCQDCCLRNGTPAERGFLGALFTQEATFQNKVLFWLSVFVTVVSWCYYLFRYNDVSVNSADRYFFFIMPTALFVLSAVYMAIRYLGLWQYYQQDVIGSEQRRGDTTLIRYILVWDKYIFVTFPDPSGDNVFNPFMMRGDTPATLLIPKQRELLTGLASQYFKDIMPMLKDADIRFAYFNKSLSGNSNTFHYLVYVSDSDHKAIEESYPNGSWLSMLAIDRLIRENQLEPAFASEIYRIYTTVMAWKTYDRSGKRRYKVKQYKPTFHLEDLKKYDVDFNDRRWLYVANDNADKPFFVIRNWWHRHLQGKDY